MGYGYHVYPDEQRLCLPNGDYGLVQPQNFVLAMSNSLDSSFCVDALEEALYRYGKPEIFNSDQAMQYTSEAFTVILKANEIRISMDGKGAWRDNVFVERLWCNVKHEEVYLNAYESIQHVKTRFKNRIEFYNRERKHQTLKTTPNQMYGIVEDLKLAA